MYINHALQDVKLKKGAFIVFISKGSLILEGIFTFVILPTKGAKAESLNFPPFIVNNLLKFFCSGEKFGTFFRQWD